MDTPTNAVDAFMASEPPERPKSKLAPHRPAIERLRAAGYTLKQICKYLASQGVSADPSLLSKFLRAPATKPPVSPAPDTPPTLATPAKQVSEKERPGAAPTGPHPAKTTKSVDDLMRENPGLSKKQAEELFVDQFQPKVTNPLLRKFSSPPTG